jgi:Glycosyl hydrolase family 26
VSSGRSKFRLRAWTAITVPALVLCVAFASGALSHLVPSSWRPITGAAYSSNVSSPLVSRIFGVALAGAQLPKWSTETGVRPQLLMTFQAWCHEPMPDHALSQDKAVGVKMAMITWDPWCPTKPGLTDQQEGKIQPAFSNQAIASGRWDGYLRRYADAVRASGLTVYLRYAHEMNGNWYPWQWDPAAYRQAWQHIVTVFRQQHATNAKFVWSGLWLAGPIQHDAVHHALAYWPGKAYVDAIGTTTINFGGDHLHYVSKLKPFIGKMHRKLKMPVMLTEVNTQYAGRVQWLQDLATYAANTPWLTGIIWCQLPSYGAAHMTTGNLNWQVATDPDGSKAALRGLAATMNKPGVFPPATAESQHHH